jgi:hypothetical protein
MGPPPPRDELKRIVWLRQPRDDKTRADVDLAGDYAENEFVVGEFDADSAIRHKKTYPSVRCAGLREAKTNLCNISKHFSLLRFDPRRRAPITPSRAI